MKELIRQAIHNYPIFKNEVEMLQQHLEARDDAKVRESLALRLSQIGIIESWFALLSADERIVLRQMIADDNEIAKQSIVWTKWMQQIIGSGISPLKIQDMAIEKITPFARMGIRRMTCPIFCPHSRPHSQE